ncbi:MAG: hypothetical protein K2X71_09275 [Methylobacterium sp.]|uniref:hypothetical protein n=1 Tax=Methylobacterium sp. TaxID=409 RepID=UPI00258E87A9|nr:hypothetical protein [Methylobacterium sp.]MBY0296216.1 hypothetical protein [Methylobacterium sp.]
MRVVIAAAGLGACVAAGTALAQAPAPAVQPLDCAQFPKTMDEAALVKRYGRENVVSADLEGAEGSTERGTVVYPKDPSRRLEISWHDVKKRRRPASIAVKGRSGWLVQVPGSRRASLGLGASLADVEEANERPFSLYGFEWDMGGFVSGWKSGKLAAMPGGCFLGVRFGFNAKAKDRDLNRVSGDKEFTSSDRGMVAVRPVVSTITLGWPE